MTVDAGEYLRLVEARYLELVGRGFSMSSRDIGLLLRWQGEGVPVRIVIAALDEAAKKRTTVVTDGTEGLRLSHVERFVGAAMKRRAERVSEPIVRYGTAPKESPGLWGALQTAIVATGRGAVEPVQTLLRDAWVKVSKAKSMDLDPWDVANELDKEIAAFLESLLSESERNKLSEQTQARTNAMIGLATAEAIVEAQRYHRDSWLRSRFKVPDLTLVLIRSV